MPHVTSIGLDVHARSVAAAAFNPFTGEVVHRNFGTDAAEIAEWALGFEEPRACYESGPTGFHMARELRALGLDCAVAARLENAEAGGGRGAARTTGATPSSSPACSPPTTSSRSRAGRGRRGRPRPRPRPRRRHR